jgi:hypothetical protein
MVALIGRKTE